RAGVLSAEGLVYAPRKRELIQALPGGADAARVDALAADLDRRGRRELASEGVPDSDVVTEVTLDLCYQGQSSTLGLPWDGDPEAAEAAFHRLHEHRYGHRLALPVQRVNVRVRCQAPARPPAPAPLAGGDGAPAGCRAWTGRCRSTAVTTWPRARYCAGRRWCSKPWGRFIWPPDGRLRYTPRVTCS
ncbi:MAG TPA: hypothetical protein DCM00_10175, partial [Alcanivorax sp.]|nr:hypothetical protein [Alcanivorax sp.]